MQTFLIDEDFTRTAEVLDSKRLHKQALEAWQIMLVNLQLDPGGNFRAPKGWYNHPASLMWRGHEVALLDYIRAMVAEWTLRGYKSTILGKAEATLRCGIENDLVAYAYGDRPQWMLDPARYELVYSTHRRALLAKNYRWYSKFEWPEDEGSKPEGYEYVWEVA